MKFVQYLYLFIYILYSNPHHPLVQVLTSSCRSHRSSRSPALPSGRIRARTDRNLQHLTSCRLTMSALLTSASAGGSRSKGQEGEEAEEKSSSEAGCTGEDRSEIYET